VLVVYRLLIDIVIIFHLVFIIFVVFGGLLLLVDRRWALIHLPAAVWGALVEFMDFFCPLTPLENWLRKIGGRTVYMDDFIEHYLLPVIYPIGLTPSIQVMLGFFVIVINFLVYLLVFCFLKNIGRRD
jgi:hypothetical protein